MIVFFTKLLFSTIFAKESSHVSILLSIRHVLILTLCLSVCLSVCVFEILGVGCQQLLLARCTNCLMSSLLEREVVNAPFAFLLCFTTTFQIMPTTEAFPQLAMAIYSSSFSNLSWSPFVLTVLDFRGNFAGSLRRVTRTLLCLKEDTLRLPSKPN